MKQSPVCPGCKKKTLDLSDRQWLPFCCERCKLIDFGAWIDGSHAIPGQEVFIIEDNNDELDPH